jgi:hypothetical protein
VGTTLGGTGWRLPTIKELQTIVDESRPSIDPTAFPGAPLGNYWSSSPVAGRPSDAWDINFNGATGPDAMSTLDNVRCAR